MLRRGTECGKDSTSAWLTVLSKRRGSIRTETVQQGHKTQGRARIPSAEWFSSSSKDTSTNLQHLLGLWHQINLIWVYTDISKVEGNYYPHPWNSASWLWSKRWQENLQGWAREICPRDNWNPQQCRKWDVFGNSSNVKVHLYHEYMNNDWASGVTAE